MAEKNSTKFVTDAATLCIFDAECLKHRLNDDSDWWSISDDEVEEVNSGNVAFIGLGTDGQYDVILVDTLDTPSCVVNLKVVSGKLFVGAGEEVTSDGIEPDCTRGGYFINKLPGNYIVAIGRKADDSLLYISIIQGGSGTNSFNQPIVI